MNQELAGKYNPVSKYPVRNYFIVWQVYSCTLYSEVIFFLCTTYITSQTNAHTHIHPHTEDRTPKPPEESKTVGV